MVFRFMRRPPFDVWLLTQAPRNYGHLLQVNEGSPLRGGHSSVISSETPLRPHPARASRRQENRH